MEDFTIYLLTTGEILYYISGTEQDPEVEVGQGFIKGIYEPELYWVDNSIATLRPESDILLNITNIFLGDKAIFQNTDIGGKFNITPTSSDTINVYYDETVNITDTIVHFEPDRTGVFDIIINEIFPTKDFITTITVSLP